MSDEHETTEPDEDLASAWQHVLDSSDKSSRAWLKNTHLVTIHDSVVVIAVPSEFARDRLENRQRGSIEQALSDYFCRDMTIAITVKPDLELEFLPADSPAESEKAADLGNQLTRRVDAPALLSNESPTEDTSLGRLNPKYTFDNFVIGNSNRFAHAAAVATAESPGKAYNPLLIYGDSGLGKTHLLHAIGHYVRSYFQGAKVKYVSTEELTNNFINAISENRTVAFRNTYRDVDVLLIDDIQFLEDKIRTQEEFFHTFNTLHEAQKQIIMTCDRHPKLLEALTPRLRSRFQGGLITDVQPPDLETRIAILRKKATSEQLSVPPEVLEFIGSRIQTNIRELEGALIRISAFASLNKQDVDLNLAKAVLKDLVPTGEEAEITAAAIIKQTAAYFGISDEDLTGSSRTQTVANARQIAMYLCRELTELSLPKIGQEFGGRDHSTVMHGVKKIRQLMTEQRNIYNQVAEITNNLKQS